MAGYFHDISYGLKMSLCQSIPPEIKDFVTFSILIQARSNKNLSSNQDRISSKLENFPCNKMAMISCDLISKLHVFGIVCAIWIT